MQGSAGGPRCHAKLREAEGAETISTFSWPGLWGPRFKHERSDERACPVAGPRVCVKYSQWFQDLAHPTPQGDHPPGSCSWCQPDKGDRGKRTTCWLHASTLGSWHKLPPTSFRLTLGFLSPHEEQRPEMPCSKFCLQLISDLGVKVKDAVWSQSWLPFTLSCGHSMKTFKRFQVAEGNPSQAQRRAQNYWQNTWLLWPTYKRTSCCFQTVTTTSKGNSLSSVDTIPAHYSPSQ